MEGSKDYYRILGITENAAEEEVKSAYRKLAKKYHPDAHPGEKKYEEMFREVNEAYGVLGDARKRKAYDGERHRAERAGSIRKENKGKLKGKPGNPLDTTEAFERFMGIKR